MARPKRVYPERIKHYSKLHTRKVKMYSGVEITALHIIKETNNFYISLDSWAFCCSIFKKSKKNHRIRI